MSVRNRVPVASIFGGALFGFGLSLPVSHWVPIAASVRQIPGYARANGFSPSAEVARLVVVLSLVCAGAAAAAFARGRASEGSGWARSAPWWCLAAAPLGVISDGRAPWALALAAAAFVTAARLPAPRRGRLGATLSAVAAQTAIAWAFVGRTPVARTVPMLALVGGLFLLFALAAARFGRAELGRGIGLFVPSVLLLPIALWRTRPLGADAAAGLAAVALPLLLLRARGDAERRLRRALPIFLGGSIAVLAAAATLRAAPVADVFEDGHGLLPASEYLAGRLPYRDIVPGHGLLTDGLLQAVEMKLFGDDYRGLSRGNRLIGVFFWPLFFAVGAAATGRPEAGFACAALSFLLFPQWMFVRVMASLAILAAALHARRRSSAGAWFVVGALVPAALLWAVEFAFYGWLAALTALWTSRGERGRNLRAALAGAAAGGAGLAVLLAARGILGPFARTTFLFLPRLGAAYALGSPPLASAIDPPIFPDVLTGLGDPDAFYFWCLAGAIAALAFGAARRMQMGERARAVLPCAVWLVAASLSVIERRHLNYALFVAPAAIVLASRAFPRSSGPRAAAVALVVWAVSISHPFRTLGAVSHALSASAARTDLVFPPPPGRWAGAGFLPDDARAIGAADAYVGRRLRPDETWLDFSSTPSLYYFLDRRCPIRYYEVAFFESPAAQREVIEAVAANPKVAAVLLRFERSGSAIDGISNPDRAPLVWRWIRTNFHPDFAGQGVEFWLRNRPVTTAALR